MPSRKRARQKESLRKELHLKRSNQLVGLVARFDVWKGHLTFLKAIERVVPQYPNVRAVVVGEMMNPETFPFLVEYKAKVLHYASRPSLKGRVHFLGWRDDILNILKSLGVLVSASEKEPFGLTVLEAFSSAVPVIGSDSGGTPEIIEHEKNGLLFRTGDDADLARCLVRLLNDRRLAQRLARAGRKTVEERFTIQQYVQNIERLHETLTT
ncbi:MAG TPA: glycosyltransferase family 4 protein [Bacteroidota bacterium]